MQKSLSNIELVNIVNGLTDFVQKDKPVPVKLSYAISKNVKNIHKILEPYNDERQRILSKNDKNAGEQLSELFKIEAETDIFTVPREMVENIADLTTKDYMSLEFMIADDPVME